MTIQTVNALTSAQDSPKFKDTRNWVSIDDLMAIYAQMPKNMDTDKFCAWVRESVDYAGGMRALAKRYNVNPGLIWRVCNGHDSDTLRKAMDIPKHPPRTRINIDTTPELKARFDAQRGGMSRGEYLERLLNLEVKA